MARQGRSPGVTAQGFRQWLARAVALTCLMALIPAWFMAADQAGYLHPVWRVLVGGSIAGLSLVMPVLAWLGRDIRLAAAAYAVVVAIGLATWPLAWLSPTAASGQPWIWMSMGIAAVCAGFAGGSRLGLLYSVAAALIFGIIRVTPSGGGEGPLGALQDVLTLLVLPTGVLVVVAYFEQAVRELDETTIAAQRVEADAAMDRALCARRRVLDGIIHDQVMTSLVAGVQTDQPRGDVTQLAQRALESLSSAAGSATSVQPVTGEQLQRLIQDLVEQMVPVPKVSLISEGAPLRIDQAVASGFVQAVREAVRNVERHARAEQCTVEIRTRQAQGQQSIEIDVRDDGRGFDPGKVPDQRLGIRVSLIQRMAVIGGVAEVASRPGAGTRVSLRWLGRPTPGARAAEIRGVDEALRSVMPLSVFVALVWVLVAVQFIVGWIALPIVTRPELVFVAQGLVVIATGASLSGVIRRRPLTVRQGLVVVGCLSVAGLLVNAGLPYGTWPGYATWNSSVVMVLVITILVRGQRILAWAGLAIFLAEVAEWAISHGLGLSEAIRVGYGSVLWLAVATLILRGLWSIGQRLVELRSTASQGMEEMAASFSTLVLREVWLTELRDQVGPLLGLLADPQHRLTEAEREACITAEGRLRDSLRAGNLVSPSVSDAIEAARSRGVEVVLVDNRGSKLPEAVRRTTLKRLEELVRSSPGGRIVARTAPEGYSEAVTILNAALGKDREFTTIDEAGTVTVRQT